MAALQLSQSFGAQHTHWVLGACTGLHEQRLVKGLGTRAEQTAGLSTATGTRLNFNKIQWLQMFHDLFHVLPQLLTYQLRTADCLVADWVNDGSPNFKEFYEKEYCNKRITHCR